MTQVLVELTMSLDGFVAGPEPTLEDPLGRGGMALHEWVFRLETWRSEHGLEGGERDPDDALIAETNARTGAVVMGRKMFSGGSGPWADDPNANGWWGDEPPFGAPVFVVTHHEREPLVLGATTFHFVAGVEEALARAHEAAGDLDVHVSGGADVAQQCLRAGLVDEVLVHVAPLLLGSGTRLFDGPGLPALGEPQLSASPYVLHLRARVAKP